MPELFSEAVMRDTITYVALGGAVACLIVYFVLSISPIVLAAMKAHKTVKKSIADAKGTERQSLWPELVKELPPLIDSLAKAGPAFWSLFGSMLFLVIAGFTAGLFSTP